MNKERVIGLSNRINEVVTSERPTSISWHKIAYASELLQNELDSKPVMPKAFENWHEWELESCSCYQDEIDDLVSIFNGLDKESGDYEILEWIKNDDRRTAIDRLLMCIYAIKYDYEVEK